MKKEYSKPTLKAIKIASTVMLTFSSDGESEAILINNNLVDDASEDWSGPW